MIAGVGVLTASRLLEVWEHAMAQAPACRSRELLAAALPGRPREALANLTVGQVNEVLLRLRESTFGPSMAGVVACPCCSERLELLLRTGDLLAHDDGDRAKESSVSVAAYSVCVRQPTSADLDAVANEPDLERSRRLLFERCVLSASCGGVPAPADTLPAEVVAEAASRMAESDPQADLLLAVSCSACGHEWRAPFDIGSFLWREIEACAGRLLRDVHTLASAYGWAERDILALSAVRRQFYLEAVMS
jgi:hypothetical protein